MLSCKLRAGSRIAICPSSRVRFMTGSFALGDLRWDAALS